MPVYSFISIDYNRGLIDYAIAIAVYNYLFLSTFVCFSEYLVSGYRIITTAEQIRIVSRFLSRTHHVHYITEGISRSIPDYILFIPEYIPTISQLFPDGTFQSESNLLSQDLVLRIILYHRADSASSVHFVPFRPDFQKILCFQYVFTEKQSVNQILHIDMCG